MIAFQLGSFSQIAKGCSPRQLVLVVLLDTEGSCASQSSNRFMSHSELYLAIMVACFAGSSSIVTIRF